jgi:hypothetical protein
MKHHPGKLASISVHQEVPSGFLDFPPMTMAQTFATLLAD